MRPLAPDTITTIQASWNDIEAIAPLVATRFYDNLFIADPALVPLFESNAAGEMDAQGNKLVQMLRVAVEQLADPETFVPLLQGLGRRHVGYGVRNEHYLTVGAALMKTLAQGLGDRFTPEVERAWRTVYAVMAETMMSESPEKPVRIPS